MLRAVTTLVPVALLALAGGCEWLRRFDRPAPGGYQQGDPMQAQTAPALVDYLNRQAAHLSAVRYNDVAVDIESPQGSLTLGDSTLVCGKPRNFLLVGAKRVIGEVVKVGSNDREFWAVNRGGPGIDPGYVYCSHDDFRRGAGRLPFPFDPDWALQALGMSAYPAGLDYKVDNDFKQNQHVLSVDTQTPQGAAVRKGVVFAGARATGSAPQVKEHWVQDPRTGQVIAKAVVKEAATVPVGPDAWVQVPTRVVLKWPQQQFAMDLRLGKPKVNEPEDGRLFEKPAPDGVAPVNLAEVRYAPTTARGATPSGGRPRLFGGRR